MPQSSPYLSVPDRERKLDTELERDMLGLADVVGSSSADSESSGGDTTSDMTFAVRDKG